MVPAVGAHAGAGGGAGRRLLRQGLRHRRSSAGRAAPRRRARERGRPLLARGDVRPRRALPSGRHPAGLRHRRAGAGRAEHRRRPACRCRPASAWLSIVPIAESRSSYNGLLVFVFIAVSASLAADGHPPLRLARAAARRRPGIAAFPIRARRPSTPPPASPSRSAACSAPWCSARASTVDMPPPGDMRAGAASTSSCATWSGTGSTRRSARAVAARAERLNQLQFLTIRRYLEPGLRRPGRPAPGARDMAADLATSPSQGAQMLLVLRWRRC